MNTEPWPAEGIKQDSSIEDYTRAYLTIDDQGNATFDLSGTPSESVVYKRCGIYVKVEKLCCGDSKE